MESEEDCGGGAEKGVKELSWEVGLGLTLDDVDDDPEEERSGTRRGSRRGMSSSGAARRGQ